MAGSRAFDNLNESDGRRPGGDQHSISGSDGPADRFEGRDDQFIWSAFKQNDEQAFIYIYQKHFHQLINYGFQFTRDVQLLEDSIQDLFIDLKRNRERLTSVNTAIKFYLYKALKRRIIAYKRRAGETSADLTKHAGRFEVILPSETVLIENELKEEQTVKLTRALSGLTERQREALFYLYYENLSYTQIQDLMGMDHVRSVRNLVYKAIAALKSGIKLFLSF